MLIIPVSKGEFASENDRMRGDRKMGSLDKKKWLGIMLWYVKELRACDAKLHMGKNRMESTREKKGRVEEDGGMWIKKSQLQK